MLKFTNEPLQEIIERLKKSIDKLQAKDIIEFEVLNPDIIDDSLYSGSLITLDDEEYIYRDIKGWSDLAQILYCKMLTPLVKDTNKILIRYKKLNKDISFHKELQNLNEKYGIDSEFSLINKNEEASFLHYYLQALKNVNIEKRINILNLGVNSGEEFDVIKNCSTNFKNQTLIGIDYCQSAIEKAKENFKEYKNINFVQADINNLKEFKLDKFDLIITIGTLQSSNLNFKPLFMSIVQEYLNPNGALIMGFPNCRWIDGQMIYGAKAKNYNFSEASVLYKDVYFCKKYLQQKKFRVTVTGKDYIFLTATSIK